MAFLQLIVYQCVIQPDTFHPEAPPYKPHDRGMKL